LNKFLTILTVILICGFFYVYKVKGHVFLDVWWAKWTVLLFVASAVIAWDLAKRTHWSVFVPIVSTLWSGLYLATVRQNSYVKALLLSNDQEVSSSNLIALRFTAADSVMTFTLVVVALAYIDKKYLTWIADGFAIVCVLNSLWILMGLLDELRPLYRVGFVSGNSSMDSSFSAITYPFLIFRSKAWIS